MIPHRHGLDDARELGRDERTHRLVHIDGTESRKRGTVPF